MSEMSETIKMSSTSAIICRIIGMREQMICRRCNATLTKVMFSKNRRDCANCHSCYKKVPEARMMQSVPKVVPQCAPG